jgi:3-keto-disaccharide hydrolase
VRIRKALLIGFLLISSPAVLFAQTVNVLSAQEKAQGWQLLFDGKTMKGWHSSAPAQGRGQRDGAAAQPATAVQPGAAAQVGSNPKPCVTAQGQSSAAAGASHWEVVDGLLTPCGDPAGYLTSDQSYKNFVLSIEFKCGEDTNSGVFVRSPQENGGYEVQIWKQQPAGYNTGAIVGTAKTARDYKFKADQWNHYQITVDGDHIVVVLNGDTTLDIHDAMFSEGNLRLQYQKFPIAFRNIKIRPLP